MINILNIDDKIMVSKAMSLQLSEKMDKKISEVEELKRKMEAYKKYAEKTKQLKSLVEKVDRKYFEPS